MWDLYGGLYRTLGELLNLFILRGPAWLKTATSNNDQNQRNSDVILHCSTQMTSVHKSEDFDPDLGDVGGM